LVDGWLDWTREKVEIPSKLLLPVETLLATDFYVMKETVDTLIEDLKVINNHVGRHTWLVGRHMSIADVIAAFTIAPIFTDLLGKNHIKPFNSILRWLKTVLDQPGVAVYYGAEFVLCKQSPIPTTAPKRDKKEDEQVEIVPDVSYLFELASTLDINDWKTKYANTKPTRPEATNWFWEHYDPNGYCLYTFHYKFFNECTVRFKTSNLFGGFLQRSDGIKGMARATCASMVILSEGGLFHIYGVWLFKGTEMPAAWVQNTDDINYYDWERVDHNNAEHRALVDDYWSWESETNFGGRGTFEGGKTYGL
jgi:elongation factor 1-gamma